MSLRVFSVLLRFLFASAISEHTQWKGPTLEGPEGETLMTWIQNLSSSEVFCHLVRQTFRCKRSDSSISCVLDPKGSCSGTCDECAEEKMQSELKRRTNQIDDLNFHNKSQEPLAVFVLGAVASGKSSFIKERLNEELGSAEFGQSAVFVNADDLRSSIIGGYEVYSALSNNNHRDEKLLKYGNKLRAQIQKYAMEQKVPYLADSITIPLSVAKSFLEQGYTCRVFYLDPPGKDFKEKAKVAQSRVEARVQQGDHFAKVYPEQIQRSRDSAIKLKAEVNPINVNSFISTDGQFIETNALWEKQCQDIFWPKDESDESMAQDEACEYLERIWKSNTGEEENRTKGSSLQCNNQTFVATNPSTATIQDLNCALIWFPELETLILDESNITGKLRQLALRRNAKRLQLRYCNVEGTLKETRFWALEALKLEGNKFSGDLKDLNWSRLEFLDLRGVQNATGDISKLQTNKLKGLWVQYTEISGDITSLVKKNPKLKYLDARRSLVSGSINNDWRNIGQELKELQLSGSRVNFHMTKPEKPNRGTKPSTIPKPFPELTILHLSNLPLNLDVMPFMIPFMYNDKIVWMEAKNSGLFGELKWLKRYEGFPTYFNFKLLNLADNQITALCGEPYPGCEYMFQGNPIQRISKEYFSWPSTLNIQKTNFSADDRSDWKELFQVDKSSLERDPDAGRECNGVKPRSQMNSCRLQVSPATFAPKKLCKCLPGHAGVDPLNCDKCVGDLTPIRNHCACGQKTFKMHNTCYHCPGPGCSEYSSDDEHCSDGYAGTLCSHCANHFFQEADGDTCQKCGPDTPEPAWILLKYVVAIALMSLFLWGLLSFFVQPGEVKSKFEQGRRFAEFMEQALLLLTFLQLATLVSAAAKPPKVGNQGKTTSLPALISVLRRLVKLRVGDVLDLLKFECDVGHAIGRQVGRLSSAFLLPLLCIVSLTVGACRGSAFTSLKLCVILMSMLFPSTIEVCLSNLTCVETDGRKEPLAEGMSFLQKVPFVKCDYEGHTFLWAMSHFAILLNAIILPESLLAVAWYINRQVWPLWSTCRWLKPGYAFETTNDIISFHLDPPGRHQLHTFDARSLSTLDISHTSLRLFTAAHIVCLAEAVAWPETCFIEMTISDKRGDGSQQINLTMKCEPTNKWRSLTPGQQRRCLQNAHLDAMKLGETFLYRYVARSALVNCGSSALWSGARNTFERFSLSDPLLFVGLNKLIVLTITGLCVKKDLAPVATSFLLLAFGLKSGRPLGSASRNELGFMCFFSLAILAFVLLLDQENEWVKWLVIALPLCFFFHLQLMSGDAVLRAYQLLEELPETLNESAKLSVAPVVWPFEKHACLNGFFNGYRNHAREVLVKFNQIYIEVESVALRCLRSAVAVQHSVQRRVRKSLYGSPTMSEHSSRRSPGDVELPLRPPNHWG